MDDVGVFYGLFYGHLVNVVAIWYTYVVAIRQMLWRFGTFFSFWYDVPKENLATLIMQRRK
jgi:hypothetical protein